MRRIFWGHPSYKTRKIISKHLPPSGPVPDRSAQPSLAQILNGPSDAAQRDAVSRDEANIEEPSEIREGLVHQELPAPPDPPPQKLWLPRPAHLTYQALATAHGNARAFATTLEWHHDDQSYDMGLSLFGPKQPTISSRTSGTIGPFGSIGSLGSLGSDGFDGMPPTAAQGQALLPGTHLPIQSLVALGVMIASNPALYRGGSPRAVLSGQAIGAPPIVFTATERDEFSAGGLYSGEPIMTWLLVHKPSEAEASLIALWISPALDYLPVGILIIEPSGQKLQLTLESAKALVDPVTQP